MATMDAYAVLLQELWNYGEIFTCSAAEMREKRVKAAKFIFLQLQNAGYLPGDDNFKTDVVDLSEIKEGKRYYAGFLFVPSIAKRVCKYGRAIKAADAADCQECDPQSYGTRRWCRFCSHIL